MSVSIRVVLGFILFSQTLLAQNLAPDSADYPEVGMEEYLFTSAAQFGVIETYGFTTCVVIALYDPETRTGALTHLSAANDIPKSLKNILGDFKRAGIPASRIEAHLLGGWKGFSDAMVKAAEKTLRGSKVLIVQKDVLDDSGFNSQTMYLDPNKRARNRSILFDLDRGQIVDYEESIASKYGRAQFIQSDSAQARPACRHSLSQ